MEPGTYISIAQIAFQGACFAVKTFRKGLNYSKDAERLVLGLEVERFRLHVWGENAGLSPPNGQPATLPERMIPICGILKDYLDQIKRLVKDADELSSRYGLLETDEPPTKSELVWQLVQRMQRSIKSASGDRLRSIEGARDGDEHEEGEFEDVASEALEPLGLDEKRKTTKWKRFRWAIRDLEKFDTLVNGLAQRISKLNDLMTETQQQQTREDNYRINMIVVGSGVDEASIELIRAAVRGESDTSQIRAAVERRALTVANSGQRISAERSDTQAPQPLSLEDFVLPSDFADAKRFITVKRSGPDSSSYYLLERKTFDANILPQDMTRLTGRIRRLVLLLRKPKSSDFQTPQAEGCIKDAARFCWWIVFCYPLNIPVLPYLETPLRLLKKNKGGPVSLLSLLKPNAKFRPPLEQRFRLASAICNTFSELYLSGWLHKGVRSENILFPLAGVELQPPPYVYSVDEMQKILSLPLVCGFDYTRHESEWATIDKARTSGNINGSIYRHPDYQGEAAEGYKVQYDIYSVGLILVEIALWIPLSSFLDAKKSASTSAHAVSTSTLLGADKPASVSLSADMKYFHVPHAFELRKRVIARVSNELAFRMGSSYCNAVRFCLELAERQPNGEDIDIGEVGLHPAMEFYNNVVIPLSSLA